jgi:hypothetical protein
LHYVNSGRVTFFLPLCSCLLSPLLLAKSCQDSEVGWSTFRGDRRRNDGRWDWGSGGSSAWSSHIIIIYLIFQKSTRVDIELRGYNGWGSDLEVHFGGNFGLEGPGFISCPLNCELLLFYTYSEHSKHRSFLMHHSLWKFLQSCGYVQKLPLLCLMLSCYGWERWGVWIATLLIFLPFLFIYTHAT